MEFSVNHPVLYLLAGILIAVVLAQSVFFLIKALRRSKEIGMDQKKIKKTMMTAAIFTKTHQNRRAVHHRPGRVHRHQRHHPKQKSGYSPALAAA